MSDQAEHWSRAARDYEAEFIDPYRADVRNPLVAALARLSGPDKVVGDLGCGIGPLLPALAGQFGEVHAVDFAEGMLERARVKAAGLASVQFLRAPFTNLEPLHGRLDVAVAVNSLVLPDGSELDHALAEIRQCLRPGGVFLGIVPAMDAVHYYAMLLLERALALGKPMETARKNALHVGELDQYDFTWGGFSYRGLRQHFWQPFEVRHRLARAGFRLSRLAKVHLSWQQFNRGDELKGNPPPWDWFLQARVARAG